MIPTNYFNYSITNPTPKKAVRLLTVSSQLSGSLSHVLCIVRMEHNRVRTGLAPITWEVIVGRARAPLYLTLFLNFFTWTAFLVLCPVFLKRNVSGPPAAKYAKYTAQSGSLAPGDLMHCVALPRVASQEEPMRNLPKVAIYRRGMYLVVVHVTVECAVIGQSPVLPMR